jgi:hypothetical protein
MFLALIITRHASFPFIHVGERLMDKKDHTCHRMIAGRSSLTHKQPTTERDEVAFVSNIT